MRIEHVTFWQMKKVKDSMVTGVDCEHSDLAARQIAELTLSSPNRGAKTVSLGKAPISAIDMHEIVGHDPLTSRLFERARCAKNRQQA
jgi:hypothetical protein